MTTRTRGSLPAVLGQRGVVEGVAADPIYVDISVQPGREKRIAIDRARHAFAYVFAGSGRFRNASDPRAILTEAADGSDRVDYSAAGNRSLVLFDRGDEIVVQAGDEDVLSSRASRRRAGRVVRTHRHEHGGRAAAGVPGTPARDVHQVTAGSSDPESLIPNP
jgi:hypothetical protein